MRQVTAAICNCMLLVESSTANLLFPGVRNPHLTQCIYQMASKFVKQFKQGGRMWQTTDRQTTLQRNVYSNRQNRLSYSDFAQYILFHGRIRTEMDRVTSEEVLMQKFQENRNILDTVQRRKLRRIGQILTHESWINRSIYSIFFSFVLQ